MKERPILFSGQMVKALLDGRKSQTRRVDKSGLAHECLHPPKFKDFGDNDWACVHCGHGLGTRCPYGQPGDQLWVRESFQPLMADEVPESEWLSCDYKTGKGYKVSYVATDGIVEYYNIATDDAFCDRVTPSIFMPRWASRITLEITGIRVQRLHDISEEDAQAEGMLRIGDGWTSAEGQPVSISATRAFEDLWQAINGSWAENPWVWCVAFKRIDQ